MYCKIFSCFVDKISPISQAINSALSVPYFYENIEYNVVKLFHLAHRFNYARGINLYSTVMSELGTVYFSPAFKI